VKIKAVAKNYKPIILKYMESATPSYDGSITFKWTDCASKAYTGTLLEMCAIRKLLEIRVVYGDSSLEWEYLFCND
jgi:hypothetical protein